MVYEDMKSFLCEGRSGTTAAIGSVAAGAIAGVAGAIVGSPFNLVKTRLQSYSSYIAVGEQHKYRGFIHGLEQIYKTSGLRGLFQGVSSSMLRTGAGSSVQLATYDTCKNMISYELNLPSTSSWVHFSSAFATGFMVCLAMNPFDVIMTRIYNQGASKKYSGILDCLMKSVRAEGFMVLFKGFWPHYLRLGPHSILLLVFMERVRGLISGITIKN
jgi:solute carrier family 25 protein 34/35